MRCLPNGSVTTVIDRSRGCVYAVTGVGVADPEPRPKTGGDIEINGVDQWADSRVIVRSRFKARPLEQWAVHRAFPCRLKKAFAAARIQIPHAHLALCAGQGKAGDAPAFPLRRARQAERRPVR